MPKTRDSQTLATALRDLASAQESIGERIRLRFQQAEEVGDITGQLPILLAEESPLPDAVEMLRQMADAIDSDGETGLTRWVESQRLWFSTRPGESEGQGSA